MGFRAYRWCVGPDRCLLVSRVLGLFAGAHALSSPTARTKQYLEKQGWLVASVEKYIKFGNMQFGRRLDVWGFGDLLACNPEKCLAGEDCGIALVQAGSRVDHERHKRKILGTLNEADLKNRSLDSVEAKKIAQNAATWKRAGGQILLVSWSKKGPRGQRKVWTPRIEAL
jgi:hypothetical protein